MNETKPSPPDWLINDIAEASRNASRAYLFYIGFLSYCVLTVVSTTDRQLVLKNEAVNLPIININVSISGFFVIAPLLAMFVFIYFQIYLSRLDELIKELRNSYAPTEKGRLSQWMLNIAEGSEHGAVGKLETMIVKFALWWTLPIVLIVFAIWFLKKHSPFLSYIVGVLYPIVGTIIALSFWCVREKVKLKGFIRDPWKITLASLVLIIQMLFIFLICFLVPYAKKGEISLVGDTKTHWDKFQMKVASYFSNWTSVDLSYQKLVTEPQSDYKESIYWIDLKEVHLEGANLTSSVLKRADLRNAQLQSARLSSAILEGANLGYANLQGANLDGTDLQGADLWGANIQGALNLTIAQLSKVKTLHEAKLDSSVMEQIQRDYPHLLEFP